MLLNCWTSGLADQFIIIFVSRCDRRPKMLEHLGCYRGTFASNKIIPLLNFNSAPTSLSLSPNLVKYFWHQKLSSRSFHLAWPVKWSLLLLRLSSLRNFVRKLNCRCIHRFNSISINLTLRSDDDDNISDWHTEVVDAALSSPAVHNYFAVRSHQCK